jgi:hypothetical protein
MPDGETRARASEAARIFAMASADTSIAERLRAAYHGHGDVLDVLWWRAHPLADTADGTPDPTAELNALRRTAYSREGSPAALAAVFEREQLARDTDRALDAAMAAISLRTEPPRETPDPSTMAVMDAGEPARIDTPPLEPAPARPRLRAAIAIIAAAIVVAGLGFGIGRGVSSEPVPTATPTPTFRPFSAGQHGSATLALLETPQTPADIPPFALEEDVVASTVHLLPGAQSPAIAVYGALTSDQHICLVIITHDLRSASTCATERTFIAIGLRLRVTTADQVINGSGFPTKVYYEYFWSSDGAIVGSSNDYPFPAPPQL